MTKETESQSAHILDLKGDVWSHHQDKAALITSQSHSISLGDILYTAPSASLILNLPTGERVHLGGPLGDALLIDTSIEDKPLDMNEVAIASTSFGDASPFIDLSSLAHSNDLSFDYLKSHHDLNVVGHHDDSQLDFNSVSMAHTHQTLGLEVRDIISDFNPITDRFLLPNGGSIALSSDNYVKANHLVKTNEVVIAFHKIDDHGILSFRDANGHEITLTDNRMLNSVVDYLAQNFNGKAGDTLMFKVANDSYIYHFHPEIYAQQFSLTRFEGLSFDGMSHAHDSLFGNYLYVDFS